jgi:hypothetical protein
MSINDTLKNSMETVHQIKCTICIKKQFSGGGLFGEDSDDEPDSFLKKSDPLSAENKHSKSEKSLKKPL